MQDESSTRLRSVLDRLGNAAEIERFMMWIAANRLDRLKGEGREFLFGEAEIAAGKKLDQGRLEDGGSRAERYQEVFRDFQQYRDDVLAVARQSGIISKEQREMWGSIKQRYTESANARRSNFRKAFGKNLAKSGTRG